MLKFSNSEYPDFGEFVIDGNDPNTALLLTQCERGSIGWCLGATAHKAYNLTLASHLRAKSITWRLVRDGQGNAIGGFIGFTYGAWRYSRPMTTFEVKMADKFDKTGRLPNRKVTVNLDTSGPMWKRTPKTVGGGPKHPGNKNGQGDRKRHNRRTRELNEWVDMMQGRGV